MTPVDPIILYVIAHIGMPFPIQKTITMQFRDKQACEETYRQTMHLIAQTNVIVRIEKQRCLTKKEFDRLKFE